MTAVPVTPLPPRHDHPHHHSSPPPMRATRSYVGPPTNSAELIARLACEIGKNDSLYTKLDKAYQGGASFEELCAALPPYMLQHLGEAVRRAAVQHKASQAKEAAIKAEQDRRDAIARQAVVIANAMVTAGMLAAENYEAELPKIIDRMFEGRSPRPTAEEKAALVDAAMVFHCIEP